MTKAINQKNTGFTLIELLIVVAIIGLLSTIVMASLTDARQKAQNSAKNQLVEQYITALELYRDDHGYYPDYGDPLNSYICFGSYTSGDDCQGSSNSDRKSSGLDTDIGEYISGPPVDEYSVPFLTFDLKGIGYRCNVVGNTKSDKSCSDYSISWYLVGWPEDCPKGSGVFNLSNVVTKCTYPEN